LHQYTIAEKVSCTGIGLHSGAPAELTLLPARAGTGIVFVRRDVGRPAEIPARPAFVTSTANATTLGRGGHSVTTVEHLLAAFYALGVDNARVELDGPEVPVMDGSAASFVYLLRSAGLFEQRPRRPELRLRRAIEVSDGSRRIRIQPAPRLEIRYALDYAHPAIRCQELWLERLDAEIFEREIAGARTFGFLRDVRSLWQAGLGRGGSFDNAVLLDDERVANPDGLRWPDEFVRHKVLDLIGDLALLGVAVRGRIDVERGGHSLHQKLVAEIVRRPDAWRLHGAERLEAADATVPAGVGLDALPFAPAAG
jgi:UDP-3-O-[3-hydroxymyristoyl] N-acetylglucosamine deacetylase